MMNLKILRLVENIKPFGEFSSLSGVLRRQIIGVAADFPDAEASVYHFDQFIPPVESRAADHPEIEFRGMTIAAALAGGEVVRRGVFRPETAALYLDETDGCAVPDYQVEFSGAGAPVVGEEFAPEATVDAPCGQFAFSAEALTGFSCAAKVHFRGFR